MTGTAMTDLALAVLWGGMLGAGLWSIVSALPRFAAPRLVMRVAPYVRDVTDPAGRTPVPRGVSDPASGLVTFARTLWRSARRRLSTLIGGNQDAAARLERAGWGISVEEYRGRQLAVALVATAAGGALGAWAFSTGRASALVFVLAVAAALVGFVGVDAVLSRAIAVRRRRIEEELPTVLDFLALCLAAGETLPRAVHRAADVGSGVVAGELARVGRDVATGSPFPVALAEASARVDVPALSRAVSQLLSALDRGVPAVSVLNDQASDAREDDRRRLLEASGRKEVAMLFPLVFLILPLSVLMAAYPGFVLLQGGWR